MLMLLQLMVLGIVLTAVFATGLLASKKVIDPSFSPPIISDASAAIEIRHPRLGRGLVKGGEDGAPGYVIRAGISTEGLKKELLFLRWSLRAVGDTQDPGLSEGHVDQYRPRSDDEERAVRMWLPMPDRAGEYVIEVSLKLLGGRTLTAARSDPFLVIGKNCCRRYTTNSYVSVLPKGWTFGEDYEPNPEERFVSLVHGPHDSSLVIDTSEIDEYKQRNALDNARELEALLSRNAPGYRRLSWRVRPQEGRPFVEWSFEVEGAVSTDILFYRGDWGFAVLGHSPYHRFRETRDLARLVARSITPVDRPGDT